MVSGYHICKNILYLADHNELLFAWTSENGVINYTPFVVSAMCLHVMVGPISTQPECYTPSNIQSFIISTDSLTL